MIASFYLASWPWLAAVWVAWPVILLVASVVVRRSQGKYVFDPDRGPSLFYESWRPARSATRPVARWLPARYVSSVDVTADAIRVSPHFPFNLSFGPQILDDEHVIRPSTIVSVTRVADRPWFTRGRVQIRYRRAQKKIGGVEVWLRRPEAFVKAVASLQAAAARGIS